MPDDTGDVSRGFVRLRVPDSIVTVRVFNESTPPDDIGLCVVTEIDDEGGTLVLVLTVGEIELFNDGVLRTRFADGSI
jgi:hypothetical protein